MTFSAKTKSELCALDCGELCCCTAECYGMLLFARRFSEKEIRLVTEHELVVRRFRELSRRLFSYVPKLSSCVKAKTAVRKYDIRITGEDAERIFSFFAHDTAQVSLRINFDIILPQCCRRAFLRGAYLSGGSVTDPNKAYHLELDTPYYNLSADLEQVLIAAGLSPKRAARGGKNVIYFKSSEEIEDFLNTIGAAACAFELMEIKVVKDVRNRANRLSNCDSFNISRSIETGVAQAELIKKTIEDKGKSYFPQELRELALLRAENPEASLRELGTLLGEPLSKSGVSHKLKRIMEYTQ